MPTLIKDNDFYSLHGIWGANSALALGRIGRGAGVVVGDVQPPQRALFAGYRSGHSRPVLLPFAPDVKVGLGVDAFVADGPVDPAISAAMGASCFGSGDIRREISMSGETWSAGSLSMTVTSFFGAVPDPATAGRAALRKGMRPAIYVRLAFDNTKGDEPMIGAFGMQGVNRPLSDTTEGSLLGFAHQTEWGFAVAAREGVVEAMDWVSLASAFDVTPHPIRRLASEGCLRFEVPAREKREYLVAVGSFRDGVITSGVRARLFQATLFADLEDVLRDALHGAGEALAAADRLDAELDSAPLSDERKFIIAHGAHSYNASSELLVGEDGNPIFVVNEGEYRMMNTLDLTIDQAFHELHYSPWAVRNELDFFAARYSFRDRDGITFTHDQGVADSFTRAGHSSYEIPNLTGCFSYMCYEETLNWILVACLYAHNEGDTAWLARNAETLATAVESILARDGNGDGIMDRDSDRCGDGSEITTFDSLDASLGQARNNLYVAVKGWSALVCAAGILGRFARAGGSHLAGSGRSAAQLEALAGRARASAEKAAVTVTARMIEEEGYIPAVFEGGNTSRIIPAVEGLVYPWFCGERESSSLTGPFGHLVKALRKHLDTVLAPGVCLDATTGGWKLSSTSRNTWPSKIFISQFVAEKILGFNDERTRRDAAHVRWQCVGCADWGATDQLDSATGKDMGSRLYPRLVSSILWIHPPARREP